MFSKKVVWQVYTRPFITEWNILYWEKIEHLKSSIWGGGGAIFWGFFVIVSKMCIFTAYSSQHNFLGTFLHLKTVVMAPFCHGCFPHFHNLSIIKGPTLFILFLWLGISNELINCTVYSRKSTKSLTAGTALFPVF
jgi:hypothetical protein